ncbi:MAG: hypothetical protein DSZ23_04450, partial [Thermodesulfatator sp.]
SGGDLKVEDYILDARCQVEGSVVVSGGKGLIAGGSVKLGGSLTTQVAGTAANVRTEIAVGVNPLLERHYEALVKEQEKHAAKLAVIKDGLAKLKKIEAAKGCLDQKMKNLRQQLLEAAKSLVSAMEANKVVIRELEADLGEMEKATVTILKTAFPNCKIQIAAAYMILEKQVENLSFRFKGGEIVANHLSSGN